MLKSLFLALLLGATAAVSASSGELLDFERRGVDGKPVRLSDYRGQWVVVNFWATWCGPCIREMPLLQQFHADNNTVTVLGVNFEDIAVDALTSFIDGLGIRYPVFQVGSDSEPLIPFEPLKGLPSTFVVSPEGRFTGGKIGEVDCAWLNEATNSNVACAH